MRILPPGRLATLIASMLALAACGPTIGLKSDFSSQGFEIGRTTRDQVISALGLPQQILKDTDGREHLLYDGSTRLVGACIGCGIPSAPVGAIPSMINQSMVKNGAEYVFDDRGVMAAKYEPTKKQAK